jgi:hypothetical protein
MPIRVYLNRICVDCITTKTRDRLMYSWKIPQIPNFNAPARAYRVTQKKNKKKILKIITHISYLKPVGTLKSIFLQKRSALVYTRVSTHTSFSSIRIKLAKILTSTYGSKWLSNGTIIHSWTGPKDLNRL